MGSRWKSAEVAILEITASAGNLTYEQIAVVLPGRSQNAVQQKAIELGFHTKSGRPYTERPHAERRSESAAQAEELFEAAEAIIDAAKQVRVCCGDETADAVAERAETVGKLALELV